MKYFYDTEFLEDGEGIGLISVGIVAEDGREYYAVNQDFPLVEVLVSEWLTQNVVPSLPIRISHRDIEGRPNQLDWDQTHPDFEAVKRHKVIAEEVRGFLLAAGTPELWADYGAYDHVVLCWLWGSMMDLPAGIPMYTNDIQQEAHRLGVVDLPQQDAGEHNALNDARNVRDRWVYLADRS